MPTQRSPNHSPECERGCRAERDLTSAGEDWEFGERRVWANHGEEQLRQILLWKQVAPRTVSRWCMFCSHVGTAGWLPGAGHHRGSV